MCIAIPSPEAEVAFSPVSHAPGPGIARWAKWVTEQSSNGIGAIVGRRVYNAGADGGGAGLPVLLRRA